jgi:hypothetical protein
MYSAYVRQLSFAVEEMAESITDEESEHLSKKYEGMTLQKILYESSVDEVLGYILSTKKQRETLKKYGPRHQTSRAEIFGLFASGGEFKYVSGAFRVRPFRRLRQINAGTGGADS